jgi:ADP-ribose pyrophosphatase
MIVPYHISEKRFVLISEYRVPIQGKEIGFPAGLIDKENESVEQTIKRELKEETGLDLKEIVKISPMVYSSAGMTDEAIAIAYVKVDGKLSDKFLEGSEEITPFLASKKDLEFFVNSEEINWGAKAWTICYNIINPNPFGV